MLWSNTFTVLYLLCFWLLVAGQEFGSCRFSNGTLLPNTERYGQYAPCAETGALSAVCCALIRNNEPGGDLGMGGPTRDECLPNGVCQNRWLEIGTGENRTKWFITYCTEQRNGGKCLNFCSEDSEITPCTGKKDSDRWCCGPSRSCCESNIGVVSLAQVLGGAIGSSVSDVQTSASSSPSSDEGSLRTTAKTTTSTSTSGPTSPAEDPPSDDDARSLGGGAIAGIVVGAIAGVVLVLSAVFFARRRAHRKGSSQQMKVHGPAMLDTAAAHEMPVVYEMGTVEKRPELYGRPSRSELSSDNVQPRH